MTILPVWENRKQYLELLLLGDEQESMIDRYLQRGELYVCLDPGPVAVCVVTDEGSGVLELQNLAVHPDCRRHGYGRAMLGFLCRTYAGKFAVLQAGTGDSPLTVPFYEACGFAVVDRESDYFLRHYDHPILEAGVLLRDRVILQKSI